ncbi:MAG TPA: universal stress protein [Mycobacteriales bacterium]
MRYENAVMVGISAQELDRSVQLWAAKEASARQVPLWICHVWEWSSIDRAVLPVADDLPADRRSPGARIVEEAVAAIRAEVPGLEVHGALGYGRPARMLLEVSDAAGMIVVGARAEGGFPGLLVGSVSAQVAAHARCPVAVIHPGSPTAADVVVGVDGSVQSDRAIRIGLAEAHRTGGSLIAVHSYRCPPLPATYAPNPGVDTEAHRLAAEELLDRALGDIETRTDIKVQRRVVHGGPAAVLLEAATGAAVLVVGARGLGGFSGLVLGSVSQQVIRHAPCPVIVSH